MVRVVVALVVLCSLAPLHASAQWWWESDGDDANEEEVVPLELGEPVVVEPEQDQWEEDDSWVAQSPPESHSPVDTDRQPVFGGYGVRPQPSLPQPPSDTSRQPIFGGYGVRPQEPEPRVDEDSYRVEYPRPQPRPQPRDEDDSYRVEYPRPQPRPYPQPRPQPRDDDQYYRPPQPPLPQPYPRPQPPRREDEDLYRPYPQVQPPQREDYLRPQPAPYNPRGGVRSGSQYDSDEFRLLGDGKFYDPNAPGEIVYPGEKEEPVDFVIGENGVKCDTSCRGACIVRDYQCGCRQNVTCFEILKPRLSEPAPLIYVRPPACQRVTDCKHECAYLVRWPDGWCVCHKDPVCLQRNRDTRRIARRAQRAEQKSQRQAERIARHSTKRKAKREARETYKKEMGRM